VVGADYFRNSKDIPNAEIAEMKNPLICELPLILRLREK